MSSESPLPRPIADALSVGKNVLDGDVGVIEGSIALAGYARKMVPEGPGFNADKDAANIVKHGLSLVEGEGVLNDPLGLTVADGSSAGESRWITVWMNAGGEVLVVVWIERDDGERLISVRRATAKERKDYEG